MKQKDRWRIGEKKIYKNERTRPDQISNISDIQYLKNRKRKTEKWGSIGVVQEKSLEVKTKHVPGRA